MARIIRYRQQHRNPNLIWLPRKAFYHNWKSIAEKFSRRGVGDLPPLKSILNWKITGKTFWTTWRYYSSIAVVVKSRSRQGFHCIHLGSHCGRMYFKLKLGKMTLYYGWWAALQTSKVGGVRLATTRNTDHRCSVCPSTWEWSQENRRRTEDGPWGQMLRPASTPPILR